MTTASFVPATALTENTPFASSRLVLSVIVPVHNKVSELSQCLKALTDCRDQECELIVVDDYSTENVREIASQYGTRYLRTRQRGGPAQARNLGAAEARGEIFLFVDADVVVPRDAFHIVRQSFAEHAQLAALFGSYDDEPACTDFCSLFKNLLHHHVHQTSNPDAATFWAGCGAIRRQPFETLGGFDTEKYPSSSIEDIELGVRLVQNKQQVRLVKQLQVKHLKRWHPGKLWRTDIFLRAVPWSRLILETRSLPNDLNVTGKSRASACMVATLATLLGSLVAHVIGLPPKKLLLVESLAAINILLLFLLNRGLYGFFRRKRGLKFAAGAVLMHWLYLLYSGTTFSLCYIAHLFRTALRSIGYNLALEQSRRKSSAIPVSLPESSAEAAAHESSSSSLRLPQIR